jgi:tRNA:m4X modification enzyme
MSTIGEKYKVFKPGDIKVETDGSDRLRCQFILQHKKRQCNMTRMADEQFCAQHILLVKDSLGGRKRIPCPLDGGHSIWEDQLKNHIEKCRAKETMPTDPWYKLDMNIFSCGGEQEDDNKRCVPDFAKWISILTRLFHDQVAKVPVKRDIRHHRGLEDRLVELENQKHALQQSSLIGHMDDNHLLEPEHVIVEFGCGRAELSRYIFRSRMLKQMESKKQLISQRYLLIDRAGPRMKLDSKIAKDYHELILSMPDSYLPGEASPVVERVKIDIKDLNIDRAPLIEANNISAVSKHLCGCATDLTLACICNSQLVKTGSTRLKGIVIALCCRHVCSYATYPIMGREWLKYHGIDAEGFRTIARMTSWAVCGSRKGDSNEIGCHPSGLDEHERQRIGFMARRVIDHGRVLSLQDLGFDARIVEYIDKDVSLENHCLVVVGRPSPHA